MHATFKLDDLAATKKLAAAIATAIVPNFVITLTGNLGAGKTTLTREIIQALGIVGSIKSPTFTLVEPYQVNELNIYHFDLYRFSDPLEWYDAGFDEYFDNKAICFIEWAEKAAGLIPTIDWEIVIELNSEQQRKLNISALTDIGETCLTNLTKNVAI